MIVLSSTTDTVQCSLSAAEASLSLRYVCCYRDITTTAYTPERTVERSDGTNAVTCVTAPAASTQRVVDFMSFFNSDTATATITIWFDDNGTPYPLWSGTLSVGQTLTYQEGIGWSVSPSNVGYAINVQALTSSPTDAQTIYFGTLPKAPVTAAATSKVYIPKSGRIKRAEIYCFSGTAGTAEAWPIYVMVNNTTNYLIASVAASARERVFSNSALDIVVSAGDYLEIKCVNPTWVTNPLTTIFGGYVYIE